MTEAAPQTNKKRFAAARTNSAMTKTQAGSEFPQSANPYGVTNFGGFSYAGSGIQSGTLFPQKKPETEEEKIKRYERVV
jgi:hypothetical protein